MCLVSMTTGNFTSVIVGGARKEVILDIGVFDTGTTADKSSGLHMCGGSISLVCQEILQSDTDHIVRKLPLGTIEGDGLGTRLLDAHFQVVLEVLPHPGDVCYNGNVQFPKIVAVSDPR
jgi:hypothetical protein